MREYYECDRCDNEVSIYDENCGQCGAYLSRYQAPRSQTGNQYTVVEYRYLNEETVIMVTLYSSSDGKIVYIVSPEHQIARRAKYCLSGGNVERMETGVFQAEKMFDKANFVYQRVDIGHGGFMAWVHGTLA